MVRSCSRRILNKAVSCLLVFCIMFTMFGEFSLVFADNGNTVIDAPLINGGQNGALEQNVTKDRNNDESQSAGEDLIGNEDQDGADGQNGAEEQDNTEDQDTGTGAGQGETSGNDGENDANQEEPFADDDGSGTGQDELPADDDESDTGQSEPLDNDDENGNGQSETSGNDSGSDANQDEPPAGDDGSGTGQDEPPANDDGEEPGIPGPDDTQNTGEPEFTKPVDIRTSEKQGFSKSSGIQSIQSTEGSIELSQWHMDYDGAINNDNEDEWWFTAAFKSSNEITSIEYSYSLDGSSWEDITLLMLYDYGIEYDYEEDEWVRWIEVDFSEFSNGEIYLRVAAADDYGNTLTEERTIIKAVAAVDNVENLTVESYEEGYGLKLSWTNPEGIEFVEVYKYMEYGEYSYWSYLGSTEGTFYIDEDVEPGREYLYRVVACDMYGNTPEIPPEVTGMFESAPIYFKSWVLDEDGIVNLYNREEYYINASFSAGNPEAYI
ncbi:MAG: hypothetical protein GX754_06410, partial [Clostridiaceae bacterium]|nr:hypothetical protein [Clostridiaceae bacterium]